MRFFVFIKSKIPVKISILVFIIATNSYGFNNILKNTFLINQNLLTLEKKLDKQKNTQTLSPLESALLNDFRNKNQIKISIIEEKNRVILTTAAHYLSVLENKDLSLLYYNLNNDFLKLYNSYPKKKLLKYDKKSLKKITQKLEKANQRLLSQTKNHNQSLIKFQNYTGQAFSKTNFLDSINNATIKSSKESAYKYYYSKDELSKKAILNILKLKDYQNITPHIQKYYEDYIIMITLYKNKMENFDKKRKNEKDLLKQLEKKENLLFLEEKLIELKYKILLQKIKISFITGDLLDMFNKSQSKKKKEFKQLHLKRVNFLLNSTQLSSYSRNTLKKNVEKLAKIDNYLIELHGYSDSIGTKKIRTELTLKRLQHVKESMVKLGIDENRIFTYVKIDGKPIASNKTKHGRLLNRRIEFKVYEDNK